jgi:hypothetical protein
VLGYRTLVSDRLTSRLLFQLPEACLIEGAAKKQIHEWAFWTAFFLFAFFCPPLTSPLPHNLLGPTKGMTKAILVRLSSDWPQGVPSKVGLVKLAVRLGRQVGDAGLGCIFRVGTMSFMPQLWDRVRKIYAAV